MDVNQIKLLKQLAGKLESNPKVEDTIMELLLFDHKNCIQDIDEYTKFDTIDNSEMMCHPLKQYKTDVKRENELILSK